MTQNLSRLQLQQRAGAGFGRMVALSLAVHLTIAMLFAADLFPVTGKDLRPLYYVDLINLPVPDPQAGRPDARPLPEKRKPTPAAAKPEPVASIPEAPTPPPARVKEPTKAVTKATPKTPPKPEPKSEPKPVDEYAAATNAIEQMRQKRALTDRLAALKAKRQSAAAAAPVEAPVGMPTGKGKSAGVDEQVWIQAYLKECWNLSKYQVTRRDLKAKARLVFDAGGQLVDYRIISPSGDSNFDESVRRAILKAKQLPFRPERRLELDGEGAVEFNLKDLLE